MDYGPVTTEEILTYFIGFLEGRTAHPECPVCGQLAWTASAPPPDNLSPGIKVFGHDMEKKESKMEYFVPAVTMICQNCGLMRHHSLVPFYKWLREFKRNSEGGAGREGGDAK